MSPPLRSTFDKTMSVTTGPQARILIAPQAFKGTLSAQRAAAAMARGCCAAASGHVRLAPDIQPIADGGDGSIDALVSSGYARVMIDTRGATGQHGVASIGVKGDVAAVELANACGLHRQTPYGLQPLSSSSVGLGDALLSALDAAPSKLLVFIGGSASTDGGSGMLQALGARLLDANGREVAPGGQWLADIARLDLDGLDPRLRELDIVVATDVTSPLTGPDGAAQVFAPQKGANAAEVRLLDDGLRHWAHVLAAATGIDASRQPGAGAAGGVGVAAMTALNARRESGFEVLANEISLAERLAACDAVMTGEGAFDAQSLLGKGTGRIIEWARQANVPVGLVCGRIDYLPKELLELGVRASQPLDSCDAESPVGRVEQAARTVARKLLGF